MCGWIPEQGSGSRMILEQCRPQGDAEIFVRSSSSKHIGCTYARLCSFNTYFPLHSSSQRRHGMRTWAICINIFLHGIRLQRSAKERFPRLGFSATAFIFLHELHEGGFLDLYCYMISGVLLLLALHVCRSRMSPWNCHLYL